jgi:hypothetical protein
MLQFSKSAQSLVITTPTGTLRIVRQDKQTTVHQNVEGREVSIANKVRVELNRLLMNQDSKRNYTKRFSKIVAAMVDAAPRTLHGLSQVLGKMPNID